MKREKTERGSCKKFSKFWIYQSDRMQEDGRLYHKRLGNVLSVQASIADCDKFNLKKRRMEALI